MSLTRPLSVCFNDCFVWMASCLYHQGAGADGRRGVARRPHSLPILHLSKSHKLLPVFVQQPEGDRRRRRGSRRRRRVPDRHCSILRGLLALTHTKVFSSDRKRSSVGEGEEVSQRQTTSSLASEPRFRRLSGTDSVNFPFS